LEEGCRRWPFDYVQDKFQGRREGEREIGVDNDPSYIESQLSFVTYSGKKSIE